METLPYLVVSVVVSFLGFVAAIRSTVQHREARNIAGGLIIGGGAFWVLMSGLEVSSGDLSTKVLVCRIHFAGVFVVTTSWLVLALLVSGHERLVNRKSIAALCIIPLITLLFAFTNQSENLFGINFALNVVSPFYPLNVTEGLGFWFLDSGYSYALMLTGMTIIVLRIGAARRLYRLQTIPMVILSSVPLALNVIYHYNTSWFMHIDPTPVSLTVAAMILLWRLIYMPRLDVIPVAHEIVIDNLLESLIILDAGNRIVDLNPKAQNLIGHPMSEAIGKPIESMWTYWDMLRKALTTGAETEKEVALCGEDDRHVYELNCSNIEGATSKLPYRLITLRDITERKLMDEKLREAERMAAIGETAAMVGHDLRNPLQGISGAVYILKQKWGSTGDQETMRMLELVESSLGYARNIVKDLMDYSKEIRLELTETTAKTVAEQALLQVRIPENVTVRNLTSETPRITVDNAKIQRVFVNLLKNAIDAMPNGGQLTLRSSESNETLEVKVTDTGEGISDGVMQNLWKPFKTTKQKGTGLGLAICKRIVEAHQGTIKVESTAGKGSTFTMTIPINQNATKDQSTREREAASSATLVHALNPTRNRRKQQDL